MARVCYKPIMVRTDWENRLIEVIEAKIRESVPPGKRRGTITYRSLSLAIGRAPGYIHGFIKSGKEPSLDSVVRLCDELGVSMSYVLWGLAISPQDEALLKRVAALPRDAQLKFVDFLKSLSPIPQAVE